MLKRITATAILVVLLSPIFRSNVSAQVVIKERVEVQAPRIEVLSQQIPGDPLPLADCSVARGVTPPDLDRYLDAVGTPNRLIVKRPGILRIEPMGGFAEFARSQGSDPPVIKQIQGEVTITDSSGQVIALINLSSFSDEGASNRSYSCQNGGPIYHVTTNNYGPSIRIDVSVDAGIYDVSFTCASCTTEGSSVRQAFFTGQTITDDNGREYEQLILRHKCLASAGLSYCFCHTAETDMSLMNTFINFSFDPFLPDRMITNAVPEGPVAVGDSVQLFASFEDFRQTPLLETDTVAVDLPDWEVVDFSVTGSGYLSYGGTPSDVLTEVPWPDVEAGMVWFVGTSSGPSAQITGDNSGRLSSAAAMATASAFSCGITGTFDLEVEEEEPVTLFVERETGFVINFSAVTGPTDPFCNCWMISKNRPGDYSGDGDSYRLVASGIQSSSSVVFNLQTSGSLSFDYTGTYDPAASRFESELLQLVSNGRPATNDDNLATYDDEYEGDRTILASLDEEVTVQVIVDGQPQVPPITAPIALSAGSSTLFSERQLLYSWYETQGTSSLPLEAGVRMDEDFAQIGLHTKLISTKSVDYSNLQNILEVRFRKKGMKIAPAGGQIDLLVTIGNTQHQISASYQAGDSLRHIAQSLQSVLASQHGLQSVVQSGATNSEAEGTLTPFSDARDHLLVIQGSTFVSIDSDFKDKLVRAKGAKLRGLYQHELSAIAHSFADSNPLTVDVFVFKPRSFRGDRKSNNEVLGKAIPNKNEKSVGNNRTNVVYVVDKAVDSGNRWSTALSHEIGHVLQLPHETDTHNLMYEQVQEHETKNSSKRLTHVQNNAIRTSNTSLLQHVNK